jgi:glucosylceramidase
MNKTYHTIGYKLIVGAAETYLEIQPRAMQTIIY